MGDEQLTGTAWAQWEAPDLLNVLIENEDIFDAIDEAYTWEF